MHWKIILILIGGTCFILSSAAFFFVKVVLRPKSGQAWEDAPWEYEDRNPVLRRYHFWCRVFFAAIIVSMLLLFIALSV